jgi:sulfate adenylyltransferase subunit 2
VWSYIEENKSKSIHLFSHKRKVFLRDGMIWSHSPFVYQEENEERLKSIVRFRTVGDMRLQQQLILAATIKEVVGEIRLSTISEERCENRRQTFRGSDGEKKTTRILLG